MKHVHFKAAIFSLVLLLPLLLSSCAVSFSAGNSSHKSDRMTSAVVTTPVVPGDLTYNPESPDDSDVTDAADTQDSTGGSDISDQTEFPIPDFEGIEIRILTSSRAPYVTDWYSDGLTSDPFSNAIFIRNVTVEQMLNLALITTVSPTPASTVQNMFYSGTSGYEIISVPPSEMAGAAAEGMLRNLNAVAALDFDRPYWNESFCSHAAVNGFLPMAAGSVCTSLYGSAVVTFFKRTLSGDLALPDPESTVRSGAWTVEHFGELCALAAVSDSGSAQEFYGAAGSSSHISKGFFHAFGMNLTEWNSDSNRYELTIGRPLYDGMETLRDMWRSVNMLKSDQATVRSSFSNGKALFMISSLTAGVSCDSVNIEFGILPLPKLSTAQREYRAGSTGGYNIVSMPGWGVSDAESVGIVLEVLGAIGHETVKDAYFLRFTPTNCFADEVLSALPEALRFEFSDIYSSYISVSLWSVPFENDQTSYAAYLNGNRDLFLNRLYELQTKFG